MLVDSCWLLAPGCCNWLLEQVVDCWLQVVVGCGFLMLVVCCLLLVNDYW